MIQGLEVRVSKLAVNRMILKVPYQRTLDVATISPFTAQEWAGSMLSYQHHSLHSETA